MADRCVVDLSQRPARFRCACCGAEEELKLPIPVALAALMGQRFERKHLECEGDG